MTAGYYYDQKDRNYNYGFKYLSSTEIQLTRTSEWKTVQPYPLSVEGLRGATIKNVVYMTGQKLSPTLQILHMYCTMISSIEYH